MALTQKVRSVRRLIATVGPEIEQHGFFPGVYKYGYDRSLRNKRWIYVKKFAKLKLTHTVKRYPQALRQALHDAINDPSHEAASHVMDILKDKALKDVLALQALTELYEYSRYFGSFSMAASFRQLYLECSLDPKRKSQIPFETKVGAAFECERYEFLLDLLHHHDSIVAKDLNLGAIKALVLACSGKLQSASELWNNTVFHKNDHKYLRYLRGKAVGIVGPGTLDKTSKEELSGLDCVIRSNFSSTSEGERDLEDHLVSVSYYNHIRIKTKLDQVVSDAPKLDWIVLKSAADEERFRRRSSGGVPSRVMYQYNPIALFGSNMGIPVIVGDVIRFAPKTVKLYGSNFYSAKETYPSTYFPKDYRAFARDRYFVSQGLRTHDPFSSLVFVKNIYRAGLIDADLETATVLKLKYGEYASILDKYYSEFTLDDYRDSRSRDYLSACTS